MSAGEGRRDWAGDESHFVEFPGRQEAYAQFGFPTLSRGFALGARGWLRALAKDFAQFALSPGFETGEVRGLREASPLQSLAEMMIEIGIQPREFDACAVILDRKLEIAAQLRTRGGVPHAWIAQMLKVSYDPSLRIQVYRRMLQVSD